MKRIVFSVLSLVLLVSVSLVFAADKPIPGKMDISAVSDTPALKEFLGQINGEVLEVNNLGPLYELVVSSRGMKGPVYLTADKKYLILGAVRDEKGKDITQARFEELNKVNFSDLPLKDAIRIDKGNGKKVLAMFTDVDCSFCRKAFDYLKGQTDYTLYVFLYPLEEVHPESKSKSIKILCADDKIKALSEAKEGKELSLPTCPAGEELLSKHKGLGDRLIENGTPLFLTPDGERIEGADVPALEKYLKNQP
jgi:thiol:disulfide interchange protein DsbC